MNESEEFFKWLKEVKGIKKIDLFEAIEKYYDEYMQSKSQIVKEIDNEKV